MNNSLEPPPVQITTNLKSWKINERRIREIVTSMAEQLNVREFQVFLKFVGPDAMRTINRQFRKKDKSTDVLTFPQMEWPEPRLTRPGKADRTTKKNSPGNVQRNQAMLRGTERGLTTFAHENILGDMIICLEAAERNAREDGHGDVAKEVCFLIAHGMLHLCGHDHQNPAEKKLMFAEQDRLIRNQTWKNCIRRLNS